MVNLPVVFNSFVAMSAKLARTLMQSDFFSSVSEAKASPKPPFVMGFALLDFFVAFIAFMG